MSLAERPRRPRLSLPAWVPPPAPQTVAPPRPVPAPPEAVQAVPQPPEPYDPRRLSAPYHARMLADLAEILGLSGTVCAPILCPRVPVPLKIGIDRDLIARYPAATPSALSGWLYRWTSTTQYRRQIAAGGIRFDLDGGAAGEITADAAEFARAQLERGASR